MKVQFTKNHEFKPKFNDLNINTKSEKTVSFTANSPAKTNLIDKVLKNKIFKSMCKFAGKNPHAFNLLSLAFVGILLRPPSIMAVPGAKKEDKEYAATKSVVGSSTVAISQLLFIIPLASVLDNIRKEITKNNHGLNNPKMRRFEAFNYLVNNGVGLILTLLFMPFVVKSTNSIATKMLERTSSKPRKEGSKL